MFATIVATIGIVVIFNIFMEEFGSTVLKTFKNLLNVLASVIISVCVSAWLINDGAENLVSNLDIFCEKLKIVMIVIALVIVVYEAIVGIVDYRTGKRLKHLDSVMSDRKLKTVEVEHSEDATLPIYAHETDAGMDIYANEDITIAPGETKLIHTGLKMAIPEGYEIQVRPRSGLSLKTPLRICNAPGTIDAGYRDEIGIIMQNTSERFYTDGAGEIHVMPDCEKNHYAIDSKDNHKGWYDIKKGDRIAQIVLSEVPQIRFKKVDSVAKIGEDREGGFGSTGTNSVTHH